jgi:hypothetical protein
MIANVNAWENGGFGPQILAKAKSKGMARMLDITSPAITVLQRTEGMQLVRSVCSDRNARNRVEHSTPVRCGPLSVVSHARPGTTQKFSGDLFGVMIPAPSELMAGTWPKKSRPLRSTIVPRGLRPKPGTQTPVSPEFECHTIEFLIDELRTSNTVHA